MRKTCSPSTMVSIMVSLEGVSRRVRSCGDCVCGRELEVRSLATVVRSVGFDMAAMFGFVDTALLLYMYF